MTDNEMKYAEKAISEYKALEQQAIEIKQALSMIQSDPKLAAIRVFLQTVNPQYIHISLDDAATENLIEILEEQLIRIEESKIKLTVCRINLNEEK